MEKNSPKSFPLCKDCALKIRSGYKYIEENLRFKIPDTTGTGKMYFWLIPKLKDFSLLKKYLENWDRNLSSFKSLFDILVL